MENAKLKVENPEKDIQRNDSALVKKKTSSSVYVSFIYPLISSCN